MFIGYKKSHGQGPLMYLGERNRLIESEFQTRQQFQVARYKKSPFDCRSQHGKETWKGT